MFYRWLFPAAFLLPLWLLAGWGIFQAGGWAFLWVLFIAIPSVFFGQLILAMLVRARGSARAQSAVSWWDVLGFGAWHALIVATGFYNPVWFAPVLVLAVVVAVALFWLVLTQLWRDVRVSSSVVLHTADGTSYIPPTQARREPEARRNVVVLEERSPEA